MNRNAFIILALFISASVISFTAVKSDQLSLVISLALSSIPADGDQHPAFFITVVDSTGKPYLLPSPLNVTITSSDERILSVQNSAIMGTGAYYLVVNASSTVPEKKTVEVSVSASGYQSSKIQAVVEPPAGTPKALDVALLPDVLEPRAGAFSEVIVTIVDAYGKPAKARSNLDVTLSSSDLHIADVSPRTIKILEGSYSGKTNVTSTGFIGNAIVTASSSDLKTDSATLKISGARPENLYVWVPSSFLESGTGFAFIGLVDKGLKPAKTPTDVRVRLISSNTSVFTVPEYIDIEAEEWSVLAEITPLSKGSASLSVMAEDIVSAKVTINVVTMGGAPYALKLYSMATNFPADEKEYPTLAVQVVDKANIPTTMQSSTDIDVYSSRSDILETSNFVEIEDGESLAYIMAVPKLPGSVKVTVGTVNFGSAEASVSVYSPIPSTVRVITPPIPSDAEVEACLVVTSSDLPAPAFQDTQVLLSSSDTRVAEVETSTVLNNKGYYARFKIKGKSPGQFSLTAIGSGLPSLSASFTVHEVRPSVFFVSYVKPLAGTQFPIVIGSISSSKSPAVGVEGVTIKLASSNISVVELPETASISAERCEVLLMGRGVSQGKTTVTFSAGGFITLKTDISAFQSVKASMRLVTSGKYSLDQYAKIGVEITLAGKPVEGITVFWNATGLQSTTSVTGSNGVAENFLYVQKRANIVEAEANVPGSGYISCRGTVYGAMRYVLEVSSNIGIPIDGSGTYEEGTMVTLTAPTPVSMGGIQGALGGKYNFKGWSGALDVTENPLDLIIEGDDLNIEIEAVYNSDYGGIIISSILLALVSFGGLFGLVHIRGRMKKE